MNFIIWFWLWFLLNANTCKHLLTHVTSDLITLLWFYFSTIEWIMRLSCQLMIDYLQGLLGCTVWFLLSQIYHCVNIFTFSYTMLKQCLNYWWKAPTYYMYNFKVCRGFPSLVTIFLWSRFHAITFVSIQKFNKCKHLLKCSISFDLWDF